MLSSYNQYETLDELAIANDYNISVIENNFALAYDKITSKWCIIEFVPYKDKFELKHFSEPQCYQTKQEALQNFIQRIRNDIKC